MLATIRKILVLKDKKQMTARATDEGEIVLRPATVLPSIEIYSKERIADFNEDDAALGKLMDKSGIK